jgi:hypothetical protein
MCDLQAQNASSIVELLGLYQSAVDMLSKKARAVAAIMEKRATANAQKCQQEDVA